MLLNLKQRKKQKLPEMKNKKILRQLYLFRLYVLLSHFRQCYVIPEGYFFQILPYYACIANENAIYPSKLELKDTSTSSTEVCYLDTNIQTDEINTPFRISIYDKRDDFAFRIVNFPHMDSNIPANPAYDVYISQLVRYARICTSKVEFINRLRGLSIRLRQQGFETNRLQNSFNSFISLIAMVLSWRSMVQPCGR